MDAANRVLWTIIGVLLIAAGGLTAAASVGWLPGVNTDSPLLWSELIEQWRAWDPWALLIVVGVAAILAWLGWRLTRGQLRRSGGPALPDLAIDAPDGRGRTVVGRSTLTDATEQDLRHIPGVQRAAVRLLGEHDGPELRARLDVGADATLPALAPHVADTLSRFSATSGLGPELVDVTVKLDDRSARRVE